MQQHLSREGNSTAGQNFPTLSFYGTQSLFTKFTKAYYLSAVTLQPNCLIHIIMLSSHLYLGLLNGSFPSMNDKQNKYIRNNPTGSSAGI
jgi:hypothetical protein